ncbi:MAG: putative DNA binding domain-containing protein [bacterium]|nr:putative DNA binding domain-containing protein [bacterium]
MIKALARIDSGASPHDLESETLEFKSERGDAKKTLRILAEAAACLANGQGGAVVLGIEDRPGGSEAIVGTALDALKARRYIFDTVEPPLTVSVDESWHDGARLLLIGVPTGAAVHGVSGRIERRVGRSCLPMPPDHVAALHAEREGRDPSEQSSGRSVDEVNRGAVDLARGYLSQFNDDRSRWAALSDRELCQALGVVTSDGELLVAGEQLFCAPPTEFVSYQHRVSAGSPPDAVERLAAPLITVFDRTLEHITVRNQIEPLLLPGGQQLELWRYPEDVVREALANALVHRRLDLSNPVQVEHFDDALAITSMGPLVSGVTVDNVLTTPSRPRNRLLARAFRQLGLIEELGTGIARMYRSMLRVGKSPPRFEESANSVRVSIAGGQAGKDFARYVASLDRSIRDDVEMLLVLRRLCSTSSVAAADVAPLFQRVPAETGRVLERIAGASPPLIEPVHPIARGRPIRYRLSKGASVGLGSAVQHRRHAGHEIEAAVVAHVREHGRITNRVVRKMFGVGTPRASAILRGLVESQVLTRTSDASRGPSVEYGPGPRMTTQKGLPGGY